MMPHHRNLPYTCLSLAFVLAMAEGPGTAVAQDQGISDIVVTAQKQSENLQDVPISVSAITSETLQAQQVANISDLSNSYKIRSNAIAPGAIAPPMTAQAVAELPDDDPGRAQSNAFGMGQPIDIPNMVLSLACEDGRHITGTTITIDNGETVA